ncbi:phakinin isoform X2 [Brienomyrus brachyistius]|uniref:phakinin isoform X2 n=1 Tax=Brienomyrus brachyistius TaxID=42636 RepID=UPI0020B337BA|nr:phakinin isoform X2 [Brienomyrus brachyistius]
MPLPRRRSSYLGQPPPGAQAERTSSLASTSVPRGVYVGMALAAGASSGLGTRVSRRALGISSVFLQGLRSSTIPVLHPAGGATRQLPSESLNSCLLKYRDKVRALEQLNRQLEEQIRHCLDRKVSSLGSWDSLRSEWEDIYGQVTEAILNNARLILETENKQASAEDFKDRYDHEQPFHKVMEEEISALYKVIDDANLAKMNLEAQTESMKEELSNLARNHEEDVKVLYKQLMGSEVDEAKAPIKTSLDEILGDIRSHWEKAIEKNWAETDTYLQDKQAEKLSCQLSQEEQQLESLKSECNNASCKTQNLRAQTESLRALKRGLENSLSDAKHWHGIELQNLSSVISRLEAELADVHRDIEQQRCEYETLLSNKMRLDLEMGTYHGILDGEERRYHPEMLGGASEDSETWEASTPAPEPQILLQAAEASGSASHPQEES